MSISLPSRTSPLFSRPRMLRPHGMMSSRRALRSTASVDLLI